jgi:hypothetical protein
VGIGSPGQGLQNPSKISGQFGRNTKNPKTRVFDAAVGYLARFLRPPATIGSNAGRRWKREGRRRNLGWWHVVGWSEVGERRRRREAERGRVAREERESGERREKNGFQNWKP